MAEAHMLDLKETLLSNASFGPQEIYVIRQAISDDFTHFTELKEGVGLLEQDTDRTPASQTRLGIGQFLLGRFQDAKQTLQSADGGALAQFYIGRCHFEHCDYAEAMASFEAAKTAGYNADECNLAIAAVHRYMGNAEQALATLDNMFGPVEQSAEYLYQRGATVAVLGGNLPEAVALYERAIQANPQHAGALFGLAVENDRHGNDDTALELYERASKAFPTGVGVLINLGLMSEDRNDFGKAQLCYKRILDCYPDHPQARLYMKDASASGNVLYDEETQRRNDRLAQVLNISVSNFELSVRSRNCLTKMGIDTLGDLTRTSEAELLASKNFGETSLYEIREILSSKGLTLGQFAHEKKTADPPVDTSHLSPAEQALLDRPISDLNLSVRARKCMVRLGLNTIGELLRKTADELLECKNFGVTSLVEIREKLEQHNLTLRGE
ncbi:DNA-directed RNA polymerase subunit alpha [Rosistilla oblonga]|uniref:DNA-directed RNA polymerase subunit alpha n=1 Tax=Rosistilla oblonga TaxID=2527990 RepID=A0A518IYS3_9BACT|nr:DNA-directed RNA polymerase subunit alpha C-terminal domain-containing protein [Rosistilla oblonga]QDV13580.1 DNA-directed RNA polymerase subunit alpha [Rosistilla oblonga]QDV58228.1 DNA-directed RNA polymerase subunit alpha [Rosistilla oblonga]